MRDLDSELWSLGLTTGEYVKFDGTKFVGGTPSSANIGNADLTISTSGARKLILGGALSTDYFTIRDSADTSDYFKVDGTGIVNIGSGTRITGGGTFGKSGSNDFIQLNGTTNRIYSLNNKFTVTMGTQDFVIDSTSTDMHFYQGTFQIGNTLQATSSATNSILIENGTAPSVNKTNRYWQYSADESAGNACPHFRTENGSIVKLYQEGAVTTVQGLADALTNQGLLASSTVTADNIGSADLTISTSGARKLILGGALSTDRFDIRDSSDANSIFWTRGDRRVFFDVVPGAFDPGFQISTNGTPRLTIDADDIQLRETVKVEEKIMDNGGGIVRIQNGAGGTNWSTFSTFDAILHLSQGSATVTPDGDRNIRIQNALTAPTALTNTFAVYSADESAGNACPHFITENGAIVKLYQETTGVSSATFTANTSGIADDTATWGGYTMGQIVQALQNHGLLA